MELPGEKAQFLMAPKSRKTYAQLLEKEIIQPKLSAVLILIYPHESSFNTILIQRPAYEGVHGGQIAFPGGKFENGDSTLMHTALRETKEEIGVEISANNILGTLTDVYIQPSNFLVTPFIGFINQKPAMIIDKREVERPIDTNLLAFKDASIRKEASILYANGLKIKTPYYDVEGFTVWGATAMMISELNVVLDDL